MRKTAILIILLLAYNGLCFAQSTGNETRIIGSWQSFPNSGETWVFNNNGTMTMAGSAGRYLITGSKLAISISESGVSLFWVYDYQISTDGKTLVLSKPPGFNDGEVHWFTKR